MSDTEDSGIREGRNENIGDDVRARALKFVSGGSDDTPKASPARRAAPKPASKPAPKPAPKAEASKAEASSARPAFTRAASSAPSYSEWASKRDSSPRSSSSFSGSAVTPVGAKSSDDGVKRSFSGATVGAYANGGIVKRATVKNLGKACK